MNKVEKMEQALDSALSFIVNLEIEPHSHLDEVASELRDKILDARAMPKRQCDVGTAEEQAERYHATGEVYHTLTLTNALEWAQMPYEATKEGDKL